MLHDRDSWPVKCKECGRTTTEEIGKLFLMPEITCDCGARIEFANDVFRDRILELRASVTRTKDRNEFVIRSVRLA
jgi:hypothetical protein